MSNIICWKCQRSVEPLERRERDKKHRKNWLITYCPYERCGANIDLVIAPAVKLWTGSYFKDAEDVDTDTPSA